MEDLTGLRLDGYELLRLLGRGAMASVYLAEQASLGRRVAVKALDANLSRDEAYVARFQQEARSAASLTHPGIVQVYEIGCATVDGVRRHYIAQEYVPGGTLGRLLARDGALPPGRVLSILWQAAQALSAAADRGLVHRDIKPDNLMLDRSAAVKVADFGLARGAEDDSTRMTQAGVALGTPLYMSPEQIEGRSLDARSDLYSLGVTAYQLLTGEPPFTGDTPLAVAVKHLNESPEPVAERQPAAPAELAAIIDRLLAKDPDDRFDSPATLLATLRETARSAEQLGWSDPSFDLLVSSSVDRPPTTPVGDSDLLERLGGVMKEEAAIDAAKRSRRRRAGVAFAAALIVGAIAAWFLSPEPLALGRSERPIQRADDVRSQLYLAKLADTPAAWKAVRDFFPKADTYHQMLALRGFGYCCLRRGENQSAVAAFERLAVLADGDRFESEADAGLLIALTRIGREDGARSARSRLGSTPDPSRLPALQASPSLVEELREAIERLDKGAA